MDHMPWPKDASPKLVEVPLAEFIPYDFLGWSSFPARKGLNIWENQRQLLEPVNVNSIVQSWLYFALLSEVTDEVVTPQSFTKASTGNGASHKVLDSTQLLYLLDSWQTKLRSVSVRHCDKKLDHVRQILEAAIDASLQVDQFDTLGSEAFAAISLSVKLLITSLIHFYNALYPERKISYQDRRLVPAASTVNAPSRASQLLIDRMRQMEWCPQSIRRICASYNFATALYLSELPRRRNMSHSGCSETKCVASDVDRGTYRPGHVQPSCQCRLVSVDVNQLIEIIRSGEIPGIRLVLTDCGELDIELHQTRDRHGFNVVSHVWSDGLGNRESNGLPACKLRQLHSFLQGLRGSIANGLFWIDTLCIPVGESYNPMRWKAIDSMASIYQDAIAVAVIDDEILRVSATDSDTDFLAYILCSLWNSRCWTYQEAVLGKRLSFITADGLEEPPLNDVKVFSGLNSGDSGRRWLHWRLVRSPLSVILKAMGAAYQFVPPTQAISLGFKLACGPQAWRVCLQGLNEQSTGASTILHRLCKVLSGCLLLLLATMFVLLTLPATLLGIVLGHLFMFTFGLVYGYMSFAEGLETLSAELILRQGIRAQLASDLASELQPKRISPAIEAVDATNGARMHQKRFVHAWNAMAERTATKFEDLHIILANLTNLIPYRITALSTPALRMRAIASSFKTLPLDLLFDRSLTNPALRDPLNAWLPLAPGGDLLPSGLKRPSMHIQNGNEIFIHLRESKDNFVAIKSAGNQDRSAGFIYLDDKSQTIWELDDANHTSPPQENSKLQVCFLVDISILRRSSEVGNTQLLRAAKFLVLRRDIDTLHCQYDDLVTLKAYNADVSHASSTMIKVPDDAIIKMDFIQEGLDDRGYRQSSGFSENLAMLATMFSCYVMGTAIILGIIASQTTARTFYIGYPVLVLVVVLLGLFAGPFFIRLGRSKRDGNLEAFAGTWRVRVMNAWLAMIAVNFAHRDGQPKRWYHYFSDDLWRGKFSY